jgi:hypothetical protein
MSAHSDKSFNNLTFCPPIGGEDPPLLAYDLPTWLDAHIKTTFSTCRTTLRFINIGGHRLLLLVNKFISEIIFHKISDQ